MLSINHQQNKSKGPKILILVRIALYFDKLVSGYVHASALKMGGVIDFAMVPGSTLPTLLGPHNHLIMSNVNPVKALIDIARISVKKQFPILIEFHNH